MRRLPQAEPRRLSSERGSVMILSLLVMLLFTALSTAHFIIVRDNIRQSEHFLNSSLMRCYAESGVQLAIHDLRYDISGDDGKIGTAKWTALDDHGADGVPGTFDLGEGDDAPSFGERNVEPAVMGKAPNQVELIVYTEPTSYSGVRRILSSARQGIAITLVEQLVRSTPFKIPRVGALHISPYSVLDLSGKSLVIDGRDHLPYGLPGIGRDQYGITTYEGEVPGVNAQMLIDQIDTRHHDQVRGIGGSPSVGETESFDFEALFRKLSGSASKTLTPGTYTNVELGSLLRNQFPITYCKGDLQLSGKVRGAGALVVEGTLSISGSFEFMGLVIVKGDVFLSGGGKATHVWGSLIVSDTLVSSDGAEAFAASLSGKAKIVYSSAMLDKVESQMAGEWKVAYYDESSGGLIQHLLTAILGLLK